jgi:hypothetical protein
MMEACGQPAEDHAASPIKYTLPPGIFQEVLHAAPFGTGGNSTALSSRS